MKDDSWKRRPPPKHWDSPEKSKQRLDAVRWMVAKKKAASAKDRIECASAAARQKYPERFT